MVKMLNDRSKDPEYRSRLSKANKWDNERTERQAEISKSQWQDPNYRKRVKDGQDGAKDKMKASWTEERRKQQSERAKILVAKQREQRSERIKNE